MLDHSFNDPPVLYAILLVFALLTTLLAAVRALPMQNVIAAAALIAALSVLIEIIAVKLGIPFGEFYYGHNFGPRLLHILPWPVPLLWIIILLNCRGVARLILRPLRAHSKYGLCSLALTSALTVVFDASLEPFAARVNHYWTWRFPETIPSWYGAPWTNFAGWAIASLLILIIISPWLIDKKIGVNSPPDFYPLVIWLLLICMLTAINATNQLWPAATLSLSSAALATLLAARNSRR